MHFLLKLTEHSVLRHLMLCKDSGEKLYLEFIHRKLEAQSLSPFALAARILELF